MRMVTAEPKKNGDIATLYEAAFDNAVRYDESGGTDEESRAAALDALTRIRDITSLSGDLWKQIKPKSTGYRRPPRGVKGPARSFGLKIHPSPEEAAQAFDFYEHFEDLSKRAKMAPDSRYSVRVPEPKMPVGEFLLVPNIIGVNGNSLISKLNRERNGNAPEIREMALEEMIIAIAYMQNYANYHQHRKGLESARQTLRAQLAETINVLFGHHGVYTPELELETRSLLERLVIDDGNVVLVADGSLGNFIFDYGSQNPTADDIVQSLTTPTGGASLADLRKWVVKVDPISDPRYVYGLDLRDLGQVLSNRRVALSPEALATIRDSKIVSTFITAARDFRAYAIQPGDDKFIPGLNLERSLANTDKRAENRRTYFGRYHDNLELSLIIGPLIKLYVVATNYIPRLLSLNVGIDDVGAEINQKLRFANMAAQAYEARTGTRLPRIRSAISEIQGKPDLLKPLYVDGSASQSSRN